MYRPHMLPDSSSPPPYQSQTSQHYYFVNSFNIDDDMDPFLGRQECYPTQDTGGPFVPVQDDSPAKQATPVKKVFPLKIKDVHATSNLAHGGFTLNNEADDLDSKVEEVLEVRPMGQDKAKKKTFIFQKVGSLGFLFGVEESTNGNGTRGVSGASGIGKTEACSLERKTSSATFNVLISTRKKGTKTSCAIIHASTTLCLKYNDNSCCRSLKQNIVIVDRLVKVPSKVEKASFVNLSQERNTC
ncbi:hypothetical protein Tco_1062186 [Tanacetum coccineum]